MGKKLRKYFSSSLLCTVGLLLLLAGLIPSYASASGPVAPNQANGFIVSPVKDELTVAKGTTDSLDISVQNPTQTSVVAHAIINDFEANPNESGVPNLILNNNSPLPANNFKSLVQPIADITLGPAQKVYLNVLIHVPANANSGGYYGAIRFVPSGNTTNANVGLTASVGTLFLVTVPGHLVQKVTLVQFVAVNSAGTPEQVFFSGKVYTMTRLDNVGNIHLPPFGKITVTNMWGHVVDTYEFNSFAGDILPNSIRKFVDPLNYTKWFGHYNVVANLAYVPGSGNALIYAKTSFWYIPIWFMIAVVALLAVIVGWINWHLHKKHSHKKSK
jgi:hypothetical protein